MMWRVRNMFNHPRAVTIRSYLLAVVSATSATLVLLLLRDILSTPIIALFFLLPVGASAVGGLGPGLVAAGYAFLTFN